MAAEVLRHSVDGKGGRRRDGAHRRLLVKADLDHEPAAWGEEPAGVGEDAAVGIEPVRAAVEGAGGIVVADLGGKGRDRARGDIGRDSRRSARRSGRAPRPNRRRRSPPGRRHRCDGRSRAPSRAPRASGRRRCRGRPATRAGARPEGNPSRCRDRECAAARPDRGWRRAPPRRRFPYRAGARASRARARRAGPRIPAGRGCGRPVRGRAAGRHGRADAPRLRRRAARPATAPARQHRRRAPRRGGCAHRAPGCRGRRRQRHGGRARRPRPASFRRKNAAGCTRPWAASCAAWCSVVERVDQLVERVARHDLVELVEGQVDAVVGHPALREVVGADALGAVARADLRARGRRRARCPCAVRSAS